MWSGTGLFCLGGFPNFFNVFDQIVIGDFFPASVELTSVIIEIEEAKVALLPEIGPHTVNTLNFIQSDHSVSQNWHVFGKNG